MAKHKSLLSFAILALFSLFVHALPLVPQPCHYNTDTIQASPHESTMADAKAPIRARGKGRAFAFRGGRGGPRGGRNAVEVVPRPPHDGGSPIAPHMSTLHDTNSTTDDTIETFAHVLTLNLILAFHCITVVLAHAKMLDADFFPNSKILYSNSHSRTAPIVSTTSTGTDFPERHR